MRIAILVVALVPALILLAHFREQGRFRLDGEIVWTAFLFGALACFPVLGTVIVVIQPLTEASGAMEHAFTRAFLHAAVPEELFKLLAIIVILRQQRLFLKRPYDFVVVSVAVGAGFAAFENMFYLGGAENWGAVALRRAVSAVPGHIFVGAIMGACLARGYWGGHRWGWWSTALIVPILFHGLYDTPLFYSEVSGTQFDEPVIGQDLAILIFAAVVLLEGVAGTVFANLIRDEQNDPPHLEAQTFSRYSRWWVESPVLRKVIWIVGATSLLLLGALLLVAALFLDPQYSGKLMSGLADPLYQYWLIAFGIFSLFHGGLLAVAQRRSKFPR